MYINKVKIDHSFSIIKYGKKDVIKVFQPFYRRLISIIEMNQIICWQYAKVKLQVKS